MAVWHARPLLKDGSAVSRSLCTRAWRSGPYTCTLTRMHRCAPLACVHPLEHSHQASKPKRAEEGISWAPCPRPANSQAQPGSRFVLLQLFCTVPIPENSYDTVLSARKASSAPQGAVRAHSLTEHDTVLTEPSLVSTSNDSQRVDYVRSRRLSRSCCKCDAYR